MGGLGPAQPGGGFPAPGVGTLEEIPVLIGGGGAPAGADPAKVATALGQLTTYIGSVGNFLLGELQNLFGWALNTLKKLFSPLLAFLRHLKDTWLGQHLIHIWEWLKRIYARAKDYEQRVKEVLDRLKKIQDQIYNQSIKPIMDLIQRVRRVLLVFKIFHIKFAEKLDKDLAGLEGRIAKVFLDVRASMNKLIDYMNLILDPFGLIHKGLLLRSVLQTPGGIIDATRAAQNDPPSDAQQKQDAEAEQSVHEQHVSSEWSKSRDILEQPYFCKFLKEINAELEKLGYFGAGGSCASE